MTNQDSTRREADAQHFAAVIVADGITVSRPNIEDWLAGQERTDLTDEVMRLLTYGNYEVPTDHDDPRSLRSMTEPQDSTNELCPDYGSHWQNAYDTLMDIAQRRLSDDELTTDDHEWIDAMAQREYQECEGHGSAPTDAAHLARARFLGADAALTAAASLTMSESDAADFLDGDGSHELRERYLSDGEPNLSGEWADDPTPYSLAVDILGMDGLAQHEDGEIAGRLTTAWEEGRDAVWPDAVTAFARRVTGDIAGALALEASCEAYVDSLRAAARS